MPRYVSYYSQTFVHITETVEGALKYYLTLFWNFSDLLFNSNKTVILQLIDFELQNEKKTLYF